MHQLDAGRSSVSRAGRAGAPDARTPPIGVALLDELSVGASCSLVAHEYGRFRNADGAVSEVVSRVRSAIVHTWRHQASTGWRWLNPARWLLAVYVPVFFRVYAGAGRLQEVLADRWAIFAYGSDAFAAGMQHVIHRSARFAALAHDVVDLGRPIFRETTNVYRDALPLLDRAAIAAAGTAMLARPRTPYDSHPPETARLAHAELLAVPRPSPTPPAREGEAALADETLVWSMFPSRAELEARLTTRLRLELVARGVFAATLT